MTNDDLERRLQAALAERADRAEPSLSGAELRARAADVGVHPVARIAGPILAAAAVLVVAIAPQLLNRHDGHRARPQQPGNPQTTQPFTPSPTPHPSTAPTRPPATTLPSLPIPTVPKGDAPPSAVSTTLPVTPNSVSAPSTLSGATRQPRATNQLRVTNTPHATNRLGGA